MSDHIMMTCTYDLEDDLLMVIGQIVVSFGQLEHIVALTIKRTSPMTLEEAEALTDGIVERSAKAKESYEIWATNQGLEAEFLKLVDKAGKVARRRNDVIHAFWAKDPAGCIQWRRNGLQKKIDIEQLKVLRDDIHLLAAEINGTTAPASVRIESPEYLVSATPYTL